MTTQQVQSPVQEAFVALHEHGMSCPQCKPSWTAIHGACPVEQRLYEVWRKLDRARRREASGR